MSLRVLAKTILFSNGVVAISVPSLSRLFLSIFLMVYMSQVGSCLMESPSKSGLWNASWKKPSPMIDDGV